VKAIASKEPGLLLITARSKAKSEIVVAEAKSAHPNLDIRSVELDLASFRSIRHAAAELSSLTDRIDILINNAGVMGIPRRTLSEDGIEMHFATNFLGHFLFTNLIMDKILASAAAKPTGGARIVNVTSAGYVLTPLRFSDYNFDEQQLPLEEQPNAEVAAQMGMSELSDVNHHGKYVPLLAYAHSSTAVMLFTTELAESLRRKGVFSFSAAPGGMLAIWSCTVFCGLTPLPLVVETGLQRHMPQGFRNPYMFYKTPSQGAASFLVAAFDPNLISKLDLYAQRLTSQWTEIGMYNRESRCFVE
jgi:NAD(P)-dependent dehydrogenase (short-subunit alcohol dehydrogenase family)